MNTTLTKNQDVERIYMQLLRDTETSVYYLRNKFNQTERQINRLRTPIKKINDPSKPRLFNYIKSIFPWLFPLYSIVFCLFLALWVIKKSLDESDFLTWIAGDGPDVFTKIAYVFLVIVTISGVVGLIVNIAKYTRAKKEYKKETADVKVANLKNIQQMKTNYITASRLAEHKPKIKAEYEKAVKLRNDLYSINWIPNRYRNIRVIYYICDMVLTSNIGIEEALKYYLLQEANNKLDKVLQKMDEIIENQNEIIVNQAVMNAQNERIIQQNTSIISHAEQIAENARVSAEYAQIGARYAEANAYFSAATYLKTK